MVRRTLGVVSTVICRAGIYNAPMFIVCLWLHTPSHMPSLSKVAMISELGLPFVLSISIGAAGFACIASCMHTRRCNARPFAASVPGILHSADCNSHVGRYVLHTGNTFVLVNALCLLYLRPPDWVWGWGWGWGLDWDRDLNVSVFVINFINSLSLVR